MSKAVAKAFEPELITGEWYLRYNCTSCGTPHVLFRDLTRGVGQIRASYIIECPSCRRQQAYDGDSIERFEHPPDR